MREVVLAGAVRTPIGKFMGSFSELSGADLGVAAVEALLARSGVDAKVVDQVIFGNARQAGGGPNPARQVAYRSGVPEDRIAYTVNMACASGLQSIALAARVIADGDADCIVAGGTESMTRLPYLLPRARDGHRLGHSEIVDAMYQDGFECPLSDQLMGRTAETLAEKYGIDRTRQDEYACESQRRCEAARAAGVFDDEIAPVTVKTRKGDVVVDKDEHPRAGATVEGMQKLKPVFKKDGTVHAGNSSGITDGAAAVLVMAEEVARAKGMNILARIEGSAEAGVDPRIMGIGPVPATAKLCKKLGVGLDDFGLIELNEAFAAQVLACLEDWKIDTARVNVNGGSIALGHPIGATGARIVVTLVHAMQVRDVERGLATLCVSGGMGQSMALRRV